MDNKSCPEMARCSRTCAWLALIIFVGAAGARGQSVPETAGEKARLDRAEQLRQVLAQVRLDAASHDGNWPAQLATLPGARAKLTYERPEKFAREESWKSWVTIVLCESFDEHPDGVWLAYADGHLQFAPDRTALEAARQQVEIARRTQVKIEDHLRAGREADTRPANPTTLPSGEMTLRILDPQGRPVEGALVGEFGEFGDRFPGRPHLWFNDHYSLLIPYSVDGLVTIPARTLFRPHSNSANASSVTAIILQEQHGWAALEPIRREDFSGRGTPRDVHLQPGCKVIGNISNVGLRRFGRAIDAVIGEAVFETGDFLAWTIGSNHTGSHFELFLPPGDYKLSIKAVDSLGTMHFVRIAPGQRELQLYIDLETPNEIVQKFAAKPAPEFDLRAWKNSKPLKLAGLRGKVVLLDFWGYWCGPCVGGMPHLMAIYDELHARGLDVIAIHDNSVSSVQELDQKLVRLREDDWKGRDLPFPIAIDGGPTTPADGAYRGATIAAYNVHFFPTTLLIDRNGMLVEQLDLSNPKARDEIIKLLDAPGR